MPLRVNLDAMIPRADFGAKGGVFTHQQFKDFPLSNLADASPIRRLLRKPDFQRETNHWTPDQVTSFIESFVDGELIPSLILWRSEAHIFVIDGGHRLSALIAWMSDDYGTGPLSVKLYGDGISEEQKRSARTVRRIVEQRVGPYSRFAGLVDANLTGKEALRVANVTTRALDQQWVEGSPEVAESSFFKINSQGTRLDKIEEMLLRNRHKGIAIAARSILRAGTGHKYWSSFPSEAQEKIEGASADFHEVLFDPEADPPVRTVELSIGGATSPVDALDQLVEFLAFSSSTSTKSRQLETDSNDLDGSDTLRVLQSAKAVADRMAGNSPGSLGLHPAVYFYNERGIHTRHLFLGIARLIAEKVHNNDGEFFKRFTRVRAQIEAYLIANKALIGQAFANVNRDARVLRVHSLIAALIQKYEDGRQFESEELFASIGLAGKILDVRADETRAPRKVSEQTKAALAVAAGLAGAPKCPECGGLMYPKKSVTYDHKKRVREGGGGNLDNIQMMHPFCNSAMKA